MVYFTRNALWNQVRPLYIDDEFSCGAAWTKNFLQILLGQVYLCGPDRLPKQICKKISNCLKSTYLNFYCMQVRFDREDHQSYVLATLTLQYFNICLIRMVYKHNKLQRPQLRIFWCCKKGSFGIIWTGPCTLTHIWFA